MDEAIAYAIEIGRGLIAAHGRKLVHRDVKPQNVLIDTDGRAKVTDFGIARSLESEGLTATGRVLGTTDYVSPEQAMGEDVDERSDVYSLGIVLYEMLTGDVPFRAETQVGVAMKHVNEPLPDVLLRAARRLRGGRLGDRPLHHQGPARPLRLGRRDGPRPRGDPGDGGGARRGATGEATSVLDSVPRSRRRHVGGGRSRAGRRDGRPRRSRLIGVALIFGGDQLDELGSGRAEHRRRRSRSRCGGRTDFDPFGTRRGAPRETPLAVDGNPTGTAWATETTTEGSRTSPGSASTSTPGSPSDPRPSMDLQVSRRPAATSRSAPPGPASAPRTSTAGR